MALLRNRLVEMVNKTKRIANSGLSGSKTFRNNYFFNAIKNANNKFQIKIQTCWGMPSVMQTISGTSDSSASKIAAAAPGGGT